MVFYFIDKLHYYNCQCWVRLKSVLLVTADEALYGEVVPVDNRSDVALTGEQAATDFPLCVSAKGATVGSQFYVIGTAD
ncbi:MAG: hypothetical protein ACI8PP_002962 [Candidatus Pseudothioglobus sp.]